MSSIWTQLDLPASIIWSKWCGPCSSSTPIWPKEGYWGPHEGCGVLQPLSWAQCLALPDVHLRWHGGTLSWKKVPWWRLWWLGTWLPHGWAWCPVLTLLPLSTTQDDVWAASMTSDTPPHWMRTISNAGDKKTPVGTTSTPRAPAGLVCLQCPVCVLFLCCASCCCAGMCWWQKTSTGEHYQVQTVLSDT